MKKHKIVLRTPFVVKSAGGAASQCLALMSAIYISKKINRPFVIQHFPYSTGGYYPIAIKSLLDEDELDPIQGKTRGLSLTNSLTVGKIIEEHPLLKRGVSYEKILTVIRWLRLEKPVKRLRSEWVLEYSRKRLDHVPANIRTISGGYFPFTDAAVRKEMDSRFKIAKLPSPFDSASISEPVPTVVIHYRIGDKRTTYSHPGIHGDGIMDPISFRQILEHEGMLDNENIYVISDEPDEAQSLLRTVGISTKTNPVKGDLWLDLCLMSRAKLIICPWSTVSQFAASFLVQEGKRVFYPDATSSGFIPPWTLEGLTFYKPIFLPPSHSVYKGKFQPQSDAHLIYQERIRHDLD